MEKQNQFYALEATIENGKKLLCWQEKKHFYFGVKTKGYVAPKPPALFNTRKEANKAWSQVPSKGANLKQFVNVMEPKKVRVVKVRIIG